MKRFYNIITTKELGYAKIFTKERPKTVYVKSENKESWSEWLTAEEVSELYPELAKNLYK